MALLAQALQLGHLLQVCQVVLVQLAVLVAQQELLEETGQMHVKLVVTEVPEVLLLLVAQEVLLVAEQAQLLPMEIQRRPQRPDMFLLISPMA